MLNIIGESREQIAIKTGTGYAVIKLRGDTIVITYGQLCDGQFKTYAYDSLPKDLFPLHDGHGWDVSALDKFVTKPLQMDSNVPCISLKMRERYYRGDEISHVIGARVRVFNNAVSVDWRFSRDAQVTYHHRFFNYQVDPAYRGLWIDGVWDFDLLSAVIQRYNEAENL